MQEGARRGGQGSVVTVTAGQSLPQSNKANVARGGAARDSTVIGCRLALIASMNNGEGRLIGWFIHSLRLRWLKLLYKDIELFNQRESLKLFFLIYLYSFECVKSLLRITCAPFCRLISLISDIYV